MHKIDTSDFIIHRRRNKSDNSLLEEWLFDPKTSELYVWDQNISEDRRFSVEKDGKYYLHENLILSHIPKNTQEVLRFILEDTRKLLINHFGSSKKTDEFIPHASS